MSEMEHHIGKLKEVKPTENESFEQLMKRILIENNKDENLPTYCKNIQDYFNDEFYKAGFYAYKNKVFEVIDENFEDSDDIIKAKLEENGDISYQLRFYNGGASFSECLEEALNKLK